MKKALVIALGTAIFAMGSFAQTNQVLSRNAVGYVKVDVLSNNFALVAIPFNAFSNSIEGIFGSQLVGGGNAGTSDNVLKFDPNTQQYVIFWKNNGGVWQRATAPAGPAGTNTIIPGQAFFIANKRVTNQTVFLMGEVPDKITAPTSFVGIVTGFQFASYSYPVAVAVTNLGLDTNIKRGGNPGIADNILTYNPLTKSYVIYWAPTAAGATWRKSGETTNTPDILAVGQGFFYKRLSNSFVWVAAKPYTWP